MRDVRTIWRGLCAGTAALLAVVVFLPAAWGPLENFDPPKRCVWAILALLLFAVPPRTPAERRAFAFASLPPLILCTWMIARQAFSATPWREFGVLLTWLLPAVMYAAGRTLRRDDIVPLCRALAAVAIIQGLFMMLQRLGIDPLFGDTTRTMHPPASRMIGTIGYQNQAAAFLALAAGAAAFGGSPARVVRWFPALALIPVCLTGCRGAAAGMLVATAAATAVRCDLPGLHRRARRFIIPGIIAAFALAALVWVTPMRERLSALANMHAPEAGVGSRVLMARAALGLFRQHPWIGTGAGSFAYRYLEQVGAMLPEEKTAQIMESVVFAREAHNDYLQFAAEFGLVGCLLATGFLASVCLKLRRIRRAEPARAAVGTYVLAYFAVHAVVSFPLQMAVAGPLGAFLLGTAVASGDGKAKPAEGRNGRAAWRCSSWGWLAIAAGLTAGMAIDAFLTLRVPAHPSPAKAAATARRLARYVPWSHRYQAYLGGVVAAGEQFEDAANILGLAETGYRDIPLLNNLGHCYARLGRWEDALKVYRLWEACALDHKNALVNLSVALENLGRYSESADILARHDELWYTPDRDDNIRRLVMFLRAERYEDGLKNLIRLYARAERDGLAIPAEIDNVRGAFLQHMNRREEAALWFARALEKNPELPSARKNLDAARATEREPQMHADERGQTEAE